MRPLVRGRGLPVEAGAHLRGSGAGSSEPAKQLSRPPVRQRVVPDHIWLLFFLLHIETPRGTSTPRRGVLAVATPQSSPPTRSEAPGDARASVTPRKKRATDAARRADSERKRRRRPSNAGRFSSAHESTEVAPTELQSLLRPALDAPRTYASRRVPELKAELDKRGVSSRTLRPKMSSAESFRATPTTSQRSGVQTGTRKLSWLRTWPALRLSRSRRLLHVAPILTG